LSDLLQVEDRVRRYVVAMVSDRAVLDDMRVEQLRGGQRHALFRASVGEPAADVVVRLDPGDASWTVLNAEREARVLEYLDGNSAPRLLDFQRNSPLFGGPVMCLSYVDGVTRPLGDLSTREIGQLAAVVGELHVRQLLDGDVGYSPSAEVSFDVNLLRRFNLDVRTRSLGGSTNMDKDVIARYSRAFSFTWTVVVAALSEEDWYRPHNRLALLHGDVCAGNIAWGPLPKLIDWEDWRIGDPAEEIAYIFTENDLSHEQQQAFWDGYRKMNGAEVSAIMTRVSVWAPVTLIGSIAWWLERYAASGGKAQPAAQTTVELEETITRLKRFERLFLRK
jgi:aminoglycoside phosphotransferase (APT) family kinase protein